MYTNNLTNNNYFNNLTNSNDFGNVSSNNSNDTSNNYFNHYFNNLSNDYSSIYTNQNLNGYFSNIEVKEITSLDEQYTTTPFQFFEKTISQPLQSNQNLKSGLNQDKDLTNLDFNNDNVYPNKKRRTNHSIPVTTSNQRFEEQEPLLRRKMTHKELIFHDLFKDPFVLDAHHFSQLLILFLSDDWNTEQIKCFLKKWNEIFLEFNCLQKVATLEKLIEKETSHPFDNHLMAKVTKQIAFCFQKTFCQLMKYKTLKDPNNIPEYLETFCELLLNNRFLESIVNEWLSEIEHSSIRNDIFYFLSLHIKDFKHLYKKKFSWHATSALYAYLYYACRRFPQYLDEELPIQNIRFQVDEIMQKLERSQDENAGHWFHLIKNTHTRFYQEKIRKTEQEREIKINKYLELIGNIGNSEQSPSEFSDLFINILFKYDLNPEQIPSTLEKWSENFSSLNLKQKLKILNDIQKNGNFNLLNDQLLITSVAKQISSCFQKTFSEIMDLKSLNSVRSSIIYSRTPLCLENFCQSLLDSPFLESIVNEWLSDIDHLSIRGHITKFLSLQVKNFKNHHDKEESFRACQKLHAYLSSRCQSLTVSKPS